MKPLYALAISAAILTSWSAVAETTVTTTATSCRGSAYGPSTCTETRTTSNGSEPANQKQISIVEERLYREQKEARIRKWEEFCKPTGFVDDMGITRLRYAHPGCDLGRNGDGGSLAQMQ
ncbi:MAG: hypothetical protein QOJ84_67 [Bradyrhizobium sp.]|jgi:hypothetical protein|nr:hypothetical protein [Bradyrhizobium sp.]